MAFTHIDLRVHVDVPAGVAVETVERVAVRAEKTCLITRSLKATTELHVKVDAPAPPDGIAVG
jgi:uncharacterized OsmC-like protein